MIPLEILWSPLVLPRRPRPAPRQPEHSTVQARHVRILVCAVERHALHPLDTGGTLECVVGEGVEASGATRACTIHGARARLACRKEGDPTHACTRARQHRAAPAPLPPALATPARTTQPGGGCPRRTMIPHEVSAPRVSAFPRSACGGTAPPPLQPQPQPGYIFGNSACAFVKL